MKAQELHRRGLQTVEIPVNALSAWFLTGLSLGAAVVALATWHLAWALGCTVAGLVLGQVSARLGVGAALRKTRMGHP